jgi:TetR/AcrR family transcriptional regulator
MKQKASKTTIDKILGAGRAEFMEHGFEGARLEAVASRAGLTKQLVYYYFKSKGDLYSVVLDHASEEMFGVLDDDYAALRPDLAVERFVENLVRALSERPYMVSMALDEALLHGAHISRRSKYIPTTRFFIESRVKPILEQGHRSGLFRWDPSPELFYWVVFSTVFGVFMRSWDMTESCGTDFSAPEGIATWTKHCVDFVLRSLGVPRGDEILPG